MKHACEIGMKLAAGAALSLMLGGMPGAQRAHRGDFASLELTMRLIGSEATDPHALIPLADDLSKVLTLSGGTPGNLAMIEVGLVRPSAQRRDPVFSHTTVFNGVFGPAGEFEVVLPPELDLRGFGARGSQPPSRLVAIMVFLDDVIEEAFAGWQKLGDLPKPKRVTPPRQPEPAGQLRRAQINRRMHTVGVDLSDDVISEPGIEVGWDKLYELAKPKGAVSPGSQTQSSGAGHAAQAQINRRMHTVGVDLSDDDISEAGIEVGWDELGDLANPKGAVSPGSQTQSSGAGHAAQAQITRRMATLEVDLSRGGVIVCPAGPPAVGFEKISDVAKPRRAGTPGGELSRNSRRAGHVR